MQQSNGLWMDDKTYEKEVDGSVIQVVVHKGHTTGYLYTNSDSDGIMLCTVYGEYDADQYVLLDDVQISVEMYLYGIEVQVQNLVDKATDVTNSFKALRGEKKYPGVLTHQMPRWDGL